MAKRGPVRPNAAQQDFLSARRPTVQPQQAPGKPNQFSASGANTQPPASASAGMSASGASSIPTASAPGASASPTSLGMEPTGSSMMSRGGRVQRFAAGGATETNQMGSWGGANAANAVAGGSYTAPAGGISTYSAPAAAAPFSTTPTTSPSYGASSAPSTGGSTSAPAIGATFMPGTYTVGSNGMTTGGGNQGAGLASEYSLHGMPPPDYMGAARGGSIEAPKEEPYRNKWKAKNHPGDSSYKFDDGGGVPDPGGAIPTDPGDPSEMQDTSTGDPGQAGDLGASLQAVQQAYQYGMQQLTGNIPTAPAGPGGDQTQPGTPQDRGQQVAQADTRPIPPAPGAPGQVPQGVLQPTPKQFNPRDYLPGGSKSSDAGQQVMAARGGSIPSFAPGGGVMPPMAPQPPTPPPTPAPGGMPPQPQGGPPPTPGPGGVGGAPPQIMRYLTGADAAPVKRVLQRQKSMDPKIPPHARTAHTIASAGGPPQQYAALQAFRRLSDTAGVHSRVALKGAGKHPPSLPHAVAFANKKFEYAPTPHHVQFSLKGKGQPTQGAARGGSIQSFEDAGGVQDPDSMDQMNAAGAPGLPSSDQPITMTVDGNAMDLSPQQLGGMSGLSFDDLMQNAKQAIQKGMAAPTIGNARSLPDVSQQAQEGSEFSPGAGYPETPNTGKLQPENYWDKSGNADVKPGQQGGGGTRTFRPQDATFGVNNEPSGAPVGKVTSSPIRTADADERAAGPDWLSAEQRKEIPGTALDNLGARRVTNMEEYVHPTPSQFDTTGQNPDTGDKPYSSKSGTPQTAIEPDEPETSGPINVNRFGIDAKNAGQAQRAAEAGGAGGRPARAASAPKAGGAAKAQRAPKAPRRVYGKGHAGLGTYQEMADGSAQYLGPQNLTG